MVRARVCVRGFDTVFLRNIEEFYRLLDSVGGRYIFKCRRGRCYSYLEIDSKYLGLFSSFPGLKLGRGDCKDGRLLPPPKSEAIRAGFPQRLEGLGDSIVLGVSGRDPVYLPVEVLKRHALIVGSTGAGKSHTAARMAACLAEAGCMVVVFDWHGEYGRLLSAYNVDTVERLPVVEVVSEALSLDESVSILEQVLELSPFQATLLTALLSALYRPVSVEEARALFGVVGVVEDFERVRELLEKDNSFRGLAAALATLYEGFRQRSQSKAENEVWLALIRRINSLALSSYANLFRLKGQETLTLEQEKIHIVNLSLIDNVRVRKLYTLLLLQKLYTLLVRGKLSGRIFLVVDEAHNIISSPVLDTVVGEARKYGLGVIAVTHSLSLIPRNLMANFNTIIVHRLISRDDIQLASQILGLGNSRLEEIVPRLAPGEALLATPTLEGYVAIKVEDNLPCR